MVVCLQANFLEFLCHQSSRQSLREKINWLLNIKRKKKKKKKNAKYSHQRPLTYERNTKSKKIGCWMLKGEKKKKQGF